MLLVSKCRANRLPVFRVDISPHESSQIDRIKSNRRNFQATLLAKMMLVNNEEGLYFHLVLALDFR